MDFIHTQQKQLRIFKLSRPVSNVPRSPHYCGPMSRRWNHTDTTMEFYQREPPVTIFKDRTFLHSEARAEITFRGRNYHCDHSKVSQGAHSDKNKAPFIYKSWQHLSPSPLASDLSHPPVFLRKRTCILACARTSLRPHFLVVRYGYMTGFWPMRVVRYGHMTGFWPMESERESSVWPLGVS